MEVQALSPYFIDDLLELYDVGFGMACSYEHDVGVSFKIGGLRVADPPHRKSMIPDCLSDLGIQIPE